jgi:hypothetical protein
MDVRNVKMRVCLMHVIIVSFVVVQTTLHDIAGLKIGIRETGKDCPRGTGSSPTKRINKVPSL